MTSTNKPAPDFLNLDVLDAEANLAPYVVRLGGQKVEVPNASSMTVDQGDRFDSGDRRSVFVELVGEETTARIWALKVSTLNAFLNGWLRHGGTDLGEGQASAGS